MGVLVCSSLRGLVICFFFWYFSVSFFLSRPKVVQSGSLNRLLSFRFISFEEVVIFHLFSFKLRATK